MSTPPARATIVVALTVALAGCGATTPRTIDATKVAQAITASARSQRHLSAVVTCPTGVPIKARTRFYCVAEVGARNTPFLVTETNGHGGVSYVGLRSGKAPLLDTDAVALAIERSIAARRGVSATVACPSGIPRQRGLEFVCTASAGTAAVTDFIVRQTDDRGRVSYRSR